MRESKTRGSSAGPSLWLRTDRLLGLLIEAGVLLLVVLSPWAYGCIEPEFESPLYLGLAGLVVLWGLRTLIGLHLRWANCPVVLCLAGLLVVGGLQVAPLPTAVVTTLSPATSRLASQLLPATRETLPFGAPQ